jgi:DNA repair protein RecO (recombination protein O)
MSHLVRAVVLSMRDAREWDRTYLLYTKERGLLRARAMGARKGMSKLGAHLMPFSSLRCFLIRAKWLPKIGGVEQERCYAGINTQLERSLVGQSLNELVSLTAPEGTPDEPAFRFLCDVYAWLEQVGGLPAERWRLTQRFLAVRWLMHVGIGPAVDACVQCERVPGQEEVLWLSVGAGGLVCDACRESDVLAFADARPYRQEVWQALRYLAQAPLDALLGNALDPLVGEIAPLYRQFVQFHVDRDVRSVAVFDALLSGR